MNHDREERLAAQEQDETAQRYSQGYTVSPMAASPVSAHRQPFITPYEQATRHKYPSLVTQREIHDQDAKPEFQETTDGARGGPADGGAEYNRAHSQWRPSYLKRRVLGGFVAAFILVFVAIEGLLAGSKRAQGLGNPTESQHYLWTYGPTGVLTILAACFARISFQTKLLVPWLRMVRGPEAPDKALLVDYLSAFQVVALYKSIRNKDFMVSAATTVSFLIKVMIVISTGLITLIHTDVVLDSYQMTIQDRFVNDPTRLLAKNTMPNFVFAGLMGNNLTYPNGMSRDYAFQSVAAEADEVRFTVDGLTNSLDCQRADVVLLGSRQSDPRIGTATLNLTVTSPNCNMKLLRLKGPGTGNFIRFERAQCDESSDEAGRRMIIMFGQMNYTRNPNKNTTTYQGFPTPVLDPTLIRSTQLLCVPKYAIERVDVARNGTLTESVKRTERFVGSTSSRTLDKVSPWAIMDAQINATNASPVSGASSTSTWGTAFNITNTTIGGDVGGALMVESQPQLDFSVEKLYDPDFLQNAANVFYRQIGAIVVKLNLMESVEQPIDGSATIYQNRLVVRDWAAHVMVGIAVLCMFLSIFLLLVVPVGSTLPQHPGKVHGLAAMLLHSPDLIARLRGAGAGNESGLREALQGTAYRANILHDPATGRPQFALVDSNKKDGDSDSESIQSQAKPHHPYVFHPATRVALGILLIGLIVALELVLRKSNNDLGLGDAGIGNIHYGWTAAPTIIFGSLALLFSVMDFEARSLAPYTMLRRGVSGIDAFMRLDLLDMSVPRALYHEIGLGQIAAFATTTAFLVASFFTVFSGTLFRVVDLETHRPATLFINNTFDMDVLFNEDVAGQVSSLVLMANLSYPFYTYENLAFPEILQTNASKEQETPLGTDDYITTTIPALRGKLTCRTYTREQMQVNHTRGYQYYSTQDPMGITVEGESNCTGIKQDGTKYNFWFPAGTNVSHFGFVAGEEVISTPGIGACSDLLYIWGHLDHGLGAPTINSSSAIRHVSAMGCNSTIETVDANVTFHEEAARKLSLVPGSPPQIIDGTARQHTNISAGLASVYSYLSESVAPSLQVDRFFYNLLNSRYAIPVSHFESTAGDAIVAEAAKFQHGIIFAQFLRNNVVPDGNKDMAKWPPGPAGSVDVAGTHADRNLTTFTATATTAKGRRRIMQDEASTRVLQALLGVALVLGGVLGWAFMRDTAVLAREATSVAGAAALVAGGNILSWMPRDAEWQSEEELKHALAWGGDGRKIKFWMGWGQVPVEDGEVREVPVMETRFGIFVERASERVSEEYVGGPVETGTRRPYEPVRRTSDG